MGWWDLLAVQGTLKSLLQHHSSKASILRCSAFFIVQFSHPYMTTGQTHKARRTKSTSREKRQPHSSLEASRGGKNTQEGESWFSRLNPPPHPPTHPEDKNTLLSPKSILGRSLSGGGWREDWYSPPSTRSPLPSGLTEDQNQVATNGAKYRLWENSEGMKKGS